MKKIILVLLTVFSSAYSQDTIHIPKVDAFKRVYFEFAIQKPQGDLADKYNKSYNIGLWFRNKISKNQFVDVGIQVDMLNKPRQVDYSHADSIVKFESSKSALKIGFRYSRIFPFSKNNSNFNIESSTGIGWSALYYRVAEIYEGDAWKKFDNKTNLNTIFLSQTIKFNVYDFGIFCSYYYTPHTAFTKNYEPHFGSKAIAVGVVFRP